MQLIRGPDLRHRVHDCLGLLDQRGLRLLLPPGLLITLAAQLADLLLQCFGLVFHGTRQSLVRLSRLRWLLTDPGFGALLHLHGDDVLHGLLHVILVEMRWYLPALVLLEELVFLAQLLPLLLDQVLQILHALLLSAPLRCSLRVLGRYACRRLLDCELAVLKVVDVERVALVPFVQVALAA